MDLCRRCREVRSIARFPFLPLLYPWQHLARHNHPRFCRSGRLPPAQATLILPVPAIRTTCKHLTDSLHLHQTSKPGTKQQQEKRGAVGRPSNGPAGPSEHDSPDQRRNLGIRLGVHARCRSEPKTTTQLRTFHLVAVPFAPTVCCPMVCRSLSPTSHCWSDICRSCAHSISHLCLSATTIHVPHS